MSTQTQPTLEQLGVTVHKSVVGNPATGYVTWEDSKEYVLGQKLISPATAQQPAGGSGVQILRGEDAGPHPPQPDFEPAVLLSEPKSPGSEVGTPFKNHVVPATGTTPAGEDPFSHRQSEAAGWRAGLPGKKDVLFQPGIKGWRVESPIKL